MGFGLPFFNILFILMSHSISHADGFTVGVNIGMIAYNLPSPAQTINLLKSKSVTRIRIFSPNHDVLNAVKNSGIQVIMGPLNEDIPKLASDTTFVINWVETNIVPFAKSITFWCISVGHEIIPGNLASSVLQAMRNINAALISLNVRNIPVSTTVGFAALESSYPPSSGEFKDRVMMGEIAAFLNSHGFPLLVTVYPYFAYANDPINIKSSYALMNSTETVVRDWNLQYRFLFDAMIDSVYWALEKVGAGELEIVVAESGWPSNGNGEYTTPILAQTYNQNLVRHYGTPKKPGKSVERYLFALFNEDQKSPGIEQHFGLFHHDMSEVYHIDF